MWTSIAGLMALAIRTIMADLDSKVVDSKIVGGFEIDLRHAPFLVSLQIHGSHICGGAIMTLSHIITACHCMSDVDLGMKHDQIRLRSVQDFTVVAGTENIQKPSADMQKRAVYEAKIHPNCSYQWVLVYDFAMAFLRNPLDEAPKVKPFNMVSHKKSEFDQETKDLVGEEQRFCYVAGWGTTVSGPREQQTASPVLKAARMMVITDDECRHELGELNDKYAAYDFMGNGQLCSLAYRRRNNDSDCNGDSGGPLFCGSNVYGLVSYGFKCGQRDTANVYAKLSFAVDWLQKFRTKERPRVRTEEQPRNAEHSSRAAPMKQLHTLHLLLRITTLSYHLIHTCRR